MCISMPKITVYQVKPAITIKLKTRTVHRLIDVVHALHLGNVIQSPTTQSGKSASMVGGQSICYRWFFTRVGRTLSLTNIVRNMGIAGNVF